MLSAELRNLSRFILVKMGDDDELVLTEKNVVTIQLILAHCIEQARQLEASRFQRAPAMIDLRDPKIALFPVARRSKPAPDGGDAA